ncbi:hypothetical protein H4R20_001984 [Coemansia guatemalensis]|uniref:Septin-type G domain-containing protein n=1 Tax=Coemansia guatemalensis TaxID=2761395 RepID=A0A9W8HWD9_9FUNG|nr:hypothetical protein H4R20_001984 [Coemansia guatemalensis]
MSVAQRRLSQRHHAPESFNLMVAGRRGVGKSTLLQTLCDSFYALQIDALNDSEKVLFARDDSSSSEAAEEVLDPFCVFDALSGTTLIRRCHVQIRDLERHHPVYVELIDTPGIDSLDDERASATINEISWEIERRLQAALDEELKPRRDKGALHSEHIHAVLYLVPPPVYSSAQSDAHSHRLNGAADILSSTDLRAIRRLGQLANVIVAVGKCDTIEESDRALLRDNSFFGVARDLVEPGRLFDFSDLPHTLQEPVDEVQGIGAGILRRLPLLLCGSSHVDEWQRMRLPEYEASSQSRLTIADWRTLSSRYNRVCTTPAMVTQGIFRDRRHAAPIASDDIHPPHRKSHASAAASVRSLPLERDVVCIKRLHQRREVSLVRRFPWGSLQLTNNSHCDFALLVDLLFHSYRRSLQCWTSEHVYEAYRMHRIAADPFYTALATDISACVENGRSGIPAPSSALQKPPEHSTHGALETNKYRRSTIPSPRPGSAAGLKNPRDQSDFAFTFSAPRGDSSLLPHSVAPASPPESDVAAQTPPPAVPASPKPAPAARNSNSTSASPQRISTATTAATLATLCSPRSSYSAPKTPKQTNVSSMMRADQYRSRLKAYIS